MEKILELIKFPYSLFLFQLVTIANVSGNGNATKKHFIEKEQHSSTKNMRGNGLCFTPNKGQIADMNGKLCPDVLYKGDGGSGNIYLRKTGVSYVYTNMGKVTHDINEQVEELIKSAAITKADEKQKKDELLQKEGIKVHRIDMDFVGCNKNAVIFNNDEAEGYVNFYYSYCPQGITNLKKYNTITYKNIYNNIDVSYYGNKKDGLKYDIIVNAHADPNQIKLQWTGAENIHLNRDGTLVIKNSINEFYESIPKVYQNINGKIIDIKARYILNGTIVSFELQTWNADYPLIIDPWVSYYGGSDREAGASVTTDLSGNVAFAGLTYSINLPVTPGAFQTSCGGCVANDDVFVAKMNANGNLLWATYIGGSSLEGNYNGDGGPAISTDNTGNILIAGTAYSTNFPVGAAAGNVVHQNTMAGGIDAFLFKLSSAGVRLWGTYYGGTNFDYGNAVISDGTNVYLYGNSFSTTGISTVGSFQPALSGTEDVFVAKFASNGSRVWGSYVGGSNQEHWGKGSISYDPVTTGIYISGITMSSNFPVSAGCHQPAFAGGTYDAFLFKFSTAGTRLWATYYGGPAQEYYTCVNTCDGSGNVMISGSTVSKSGISSAGAYQVNHGWTSGIYTSDSYLVKFNSLGVRQWGTYLGGNMGEYSWGLATDKSNNIYVVGEFEDVLNTNYPISVCAYQPVSIQLNQQEDYFIAKYDPNGKQRCITYFGGSNDDDADGFGNNVSIYGNSLYIAGFTWGSLPVTPGAYQTVYGGGPADYFIAQLCINICEAKVSGLNYSASSTNVCTSGPVTFTPSVSASCDTSGYKFHWTFTGGTPASSDSVKPTVTFSGTGTFDVKLVLTTLCQKDSITKLSYITVNSCGGFSANVNSATTCNSATPCPTLTATGTSGVLPYSYLWSTSATTSGITLCPATTTNYTVTITDNAGKIATSIATITVNPSVTATTIPTKTTCNGVSDGSVTINITGGTPDYSYSWSTGVTSITSSTSQQLNNLNPGTYSITIIDANSCTTTAVGTIISPPLFVGQFIKGTANCLSCGCKEWIMINAVGGTNPYSYSWPDGYVNRYKHQLCPGNYTVNIKDKNGCSINVSVNTP